MNIRIGTGVANFCIFADANCRIANSNNFHRIKQILSYGNKPFV